MIRLEPMEEAEFQAFVARAVPRRAEKWVERGIWTEAGALAASQTNVTQRLPQGRETPGNHFCKVLDPTKSGSVGEVWYHAEEQGGKLQFWVEWIQIDPEYRRKGYATDVLRTLEAAARGLGADRIGLTVDRQPERDAAVLEAGVQPGQREHDQAVGAFPLERSRRCFDPPVPGESLLERDTFPSGEAVRGGRVQQ